MWLCDDRIDCPKPCELKCHFKGLSKPKYCPYDGTKIVWVRKKKSKEV